MRKFKPLFAILFAIAFILGVGFTVALGQSTTNKLFFNDSSELRFDLGVYSNSYLTTGDELSLTYRNSYDANHYVQESISCEKSNDEVGVIYDCEMISRLYKNSDNSLVRTSYFPGDNFKYTDNGETLVKTDFSNIQLSTYISSIISGATSVNSFVYYDHLYPAYESTYTYENAFSFKFNTFSIHKEISMFYINGEEKSNIATFTYDGKDRLIGLKYNDTLVLSIDYDEEDLDIPSLKDYQYLGEGL